MEIIETGRKYKITCTAADGSKFEFEILAGSAEQAQAKLAAYLQECIEQLQK